MSCLLDTYRHSSAGPSQQLRDHLLVRLKHVPSLGFTRDIWSWSVCPMSLLSFIAQWVDSSFNLQRATLHAQNFRGSHMAERMKQAIEGMLNSWGIEKQRVHAILQDNARDKKKAMDDMGVPSIRCVNLSCMRGCSLSAHTSEHEEDYRTFQTFSLGLFMSGRYLD